jgi:hypothetical protein
MQLTAFIKYVAYEFNKRNLFFSSHSSSLSFVLGWHEEQDLDCKTPIGPLTRLL